MAVDEKPDEVVPAPAIRLQGGSSYYQQFRKIIGYCDLAKLAFAAERAPPSLDPVRQLSGSLERPGIRLAALVAPYRVAR